MHLVLAHCTALLDDLWVFLLECQEGDESCRLKCNFISSNHLHKKSFSANKYYTLNEVIQMDNPKLQYTIGFGEKSVDLNPEKS